MAVNVGTLVIDLVAGTASFSQSMDKMAHLSAKTANDISKSLTKIGVAGAAAVAAIAGSLTAIVKTAFDSVDALGKASAAAGTTAETLSTLQYAAALSNVETGELTKSLEKLSKAELGAATGNQELERVFRKLGVAVSDGSGHLKDSGVLYEQLSQKFAKMPDGAVKTALAMQLFGKAGAAQIPLLNQLGEDLEGVRKEAEQFGLVVGKDVAELAGKAHDNLDRMHQVLKGIGYSILGAVLPAMDELLQKLIDLAKQANIPELAKSFGKTLSDGIMAVGNALIFAAKHATALKVALEALVAVQLGRFLIPIIGDLAAGGWAKVGDGVARFATNLLGLNRVLPTLAKLSTWLVDGVKFIGLLAAEEGILSAATYALGGVFTLMGGWIGVAVAAAAALGTALYALRDSEFTLGDTTYKVRDIWNAAWIAMGKALDNIKSIFTNVVNWIKALWKGFIDWLGVNSILKPVMDGLAAMMGAVGRVLGRFMPQWMKDSLDQAKAERERAEKSISTAIGGKKTAAGAEATVGGLAKPEKDPYAEALQKLDLAITAQASYIAVLGKTPDEIAKVVAAEKAKAIILETNKKLTDEGKAALNDKQKAEIGARAAMAETLKLIDETGKSLQGQIDQQKLAATAADLLTAAQLRGVDAARDQQVANDIAALKFGKTTDQLRTLGPLFDQVGAAMRRALDQKPINDFTLAIDNQIKRMNLEADEAEIMAAAIGKGDAAIEAAKTQIELMNMGFEKGAAELAVLTANTDKFTEARARANATAVLQQSQQNLKALQEQAEEQRILTAAIFGTVDAQRQAEIQAKTLDVNRRIAATTNAAVIAQLEKERDQIVANTKAEQDRKDAQDALALRSPWEIYQRETEALEKQIDALKRAHGGQLDYNEALVVAAKQQELMNKAIDAEISLLLKSGSAVDGVRAFFLEMQKSAVSASKIIFDALMTTFDKLSDNLANLMTGQKADWAAMFKDIGHQMAQQSIKAVMAQGLGALGKALGINLQKADGSERNPFYVIPMGALGAGAGGGGLNIPGLGGMGPLSGDFAIPALTGALGKLGGFFGKLGSSFSGAFATGGTVEPGSAYLVGERGPELYTPGAPGSIHTADETGRLMTGGPGGAVHYYTIDARGTDPALTEQRTRQAIIAAHQSAIMTSTQVQQEKAQRTPPMVRR